MTLVSIKDIILLFNSNKKIKAIEYEFREKDKQIAQYDTIQDLIERYVPRCDVIDSIKFNR